MSNFSKKGAVNTCTNTCTKFVFLGNAGGVFGTVCGMGRKCGNVQKTQQIQGFGGYLNGAPAATRTRDPLLRRQGTSAHKRCNTSMLHGAFVNTCTYTCENFRKSVTGTPFPGRGTMNRKNMGPSWGTTAGAGAKTPHYFRPYGLETRETWRGTRQANSSFIPVAIVRSRHSDHLLSLLNKLNRGDHEQRR